MCLNLLSGDDSISYIAEKDMTVYKVITKQRYNNFYQTPFYFATVSFGEVIRSKLVKQRDMVHIGLHSYAELDDAKHLAGIFNGEVAECIIPKNAEYYDGLAHIGFRSGGFHSYASSHIKYLEIV